MNLDWLSWSNPVAPWWIFLVTASLVNILVWFWTKIYLSSKPETKMMVWLSAVYVFGCAFRSVLPRADVQRICLFDTFLSSVFLGRLVATIAEVSFVAQWAIVLNRISKLTGTTLAEKISVVVVPLICVAECFSWYAVIRTHYFGNTIEESIWGVTYTLIAVCLFLLRPKFKGIVKDFVAFLILGCVLYVSFMALVDVPMYFHRWQSDDLINKNLFGLIDGLKDLRTHWVVTYDSNLWKDEVPWMSLYFTVAVWTSLMLCYVPLTPKGLLKMAHLKSDPIGNPVSRQIATEQNIY